jgi:hypothetical protein
MTAFNILQGALTPIQVQLTAYETAFDAAQNRNKGKVDVLTKNEAKEVLMKALRGFIKAYLTYNPAVSFRTLTRKAWADPCMTAPEPRPAPTTIPELELDSSVIRKITVHFRDAGSDRRGKPAHVHDVELRGDSWKMRRHQWKTSKILLLIR